MSTTIIENTIANPARQGITARAVIDGIGDRSGEYTARIHGGSSGFSIRVEGPEGPFERVFSGDRIEIRNFFERAIPRDVPRSIHVLCDQCVTRGSLYLPMLKGPLSVGPKKIP